jgi:type IV fimbrial biogenesis protein FimT
MALGPRRRSRATGFTLIEMMVTISVAVILLGIAVPSFRELIANQRIKSASFDLFSAVSLARSEAIKRRVNITLRAGATADGGWETGWRIADGATTLRSWSAVSNLSVVEKVGGASTVTFGTDGRLTAAAPRLEIASAVSLSGVTARCIQVDLSGRPATKVGACP